MFIVRDMWLTGFDAPCLHTMYADKPMQGHGLMQAIARVNRVLTPSLPPLGRASLNSAHCLSRTHPACSAQGQARRLDCGLPRPRRSTQAGARHLHESGGQGSPTYDTKQAIAVMHEKHGIACDMLHGFNWDKWTIGTPTERLGGKGEG